MKKAHLNDVVAASLNISLIAFVFLKSVQLLSFGLNAKTDSSFPSI